MYIYKFLDKDNNVLYIGNTKDILSRILNHKNLPEECYDNVECIEFARVKNEMEMDIYEIYYINKFNPQYNKKSKYKSGSGDFNLEPLNFEFKISKEFLKYRKIKPCNNKYHHTDIVEHKDMVSCFNLNFSYAKIENLNFNISNTIDINLIEYIIKDLNENYTKKKNALIKSSDDDLGHFPKELHNSPSFIYNLKFHSKDVELNNNAIEYVRKLDWKYFVSSTYDPYYRDRWFNNTALMYNVGMEYPNVTFEVDTYYHFIYIFKNNIVMLEHGIFN